MKNKKLNLKELKINSFVTSLGSNHRQTVEGGATTIILFLSGVLISAYATVHNTEVATGAPCPALTKNGNDTPCPLNSAASNCLQCQNQYE